MATENKGIYFTELSLKNVRCFGDEAVLKLSNDKGEWTRWNVILGDNGTGKTTLLQCLAGMEQHIDKLDLPKNAKDEIFRSISIFCYNEKSPNFRRSFRNYIVTDELIVTDIFCKAFKSGKLFTLGFSQYIDDLTVPADFFVDIDSMEDEIDIFILGYGATRFMSFKILTDKEPENSNTLFDNDAKLINVEEWLLQRDYYLIRNFGPEVANEDRTKIFELLRGILPDIEEISFIEQYTSEKDSLPKIEFRTPYGWVGLQQLSLGYQSMIAWILDVFARMFKKYPDSPNPLEEPVIILVDEIDLHLHPKWQRQIFEFLEKRFPRAQFIVTAHSPLIVQSAPKDANIIVLKKEQVGDEFVVKIDNDVKSVWSWRLDQIMASDLFGVEGLRNPEIDRQMEERTKLIQKGEDNLTKVEKERLDELNEMAYGLPTADNPDDIEAMEIIRQAAKFIKSQKKQNDQAK